MEISGVGSDVASTVSFQNLQLGDKIATAVDRKVLDAMKSEGDAIVSLIRSAAQPAGNSGVVSPNGRLDATA